MKLAIFGLSISSAWGNGHATLWRALCRALVAHSHYPIFFEKNTDYYAAHRDLWEIEGGRLVLYDEWKNVLPLARHHLADADAGVITSYCPDALSAAVELCDGRATRVFYDLDTPVTLDALRSGRHVPYIGPRGLVDFDLVLSYTGGAALRQLKQMLGAPMVRPLYGSVDPEVHRPVSHSLQFDSALSYLGTYAADRQRMLECLFVQSARHLPDYRFLMGGSMYPDAFPWLPNIYYAGHVAPPQHPEFYCSAKLNLSVTRGVMAEAGFCPSGRLFEAAACGAPVMTDYWEGLEQFFEPEREVLLATTTEEAIDCITRPADELASIGNAARERVLAEHTAAHRVIELENAIQGAYRTFSQPVSETL